MKILLPSQRDWQRSIVKSVKKYGLAFLNAADYAQPGAADREHLDEEGHQRLAEAVLHVIKNIIDKKIQ